MSKIMAVNAGSSSLKFQLLKMPNEVVITEGIIERIGMSNSKFTIKVDGEKRSEIASIPDHEIAVQMLLEALVDLKIVKNLEEIAGVGHRVVHGGEMFSDSVLVTDEVINAIESVNDLAPLHNPANLTGIRAFLEILPNVPAVAVFDTAFHQTMSRDAYMYATPYEWYEKYGVRKYGFHGTSHRYIANRTAEIMKKDVKDLKIISLHLGNGASLCAIDGGKSVETSMGLTPLDGIPMGTRSGSIDPAIIEFIANKEDKTVSEVTSDLNKNSGYLGVSGVSSDSRDIEAGIEDGCARCELAREIHVKRIVDYIASYYVYLGGCDAIVFTAGIGENSSDIRRRVSEELKILGVDFDEDANNVRGEERLISKKDSKIAVFLIPTNEEVMIARDTIRLADL